MNALSMKVAGIDTSKKELAVHLLSSGERFSAGNDKAGIATLVAKCREAGIVRAGIEATSIYHRAAAKALRKAKIEVVELQPRQARAFAEALLKWAKNDPIDALVIARLTQIVDTPPPGQSSKIEALAEHLTYIEQLEERIAWLKTTRERFSQARFTKGIDADIKALEKSRRAELRRLEASLRRDAELAQRLDLLLSIPCLAERSAIGFLIRMPELGSLSRQQVASLAGLAPCDDDSGTHKGERHIYGGRTRLRSTAFMAAFAGALHWNDDLMAFYQNLRAKGKTHTLAITACARKLLIIANAVLTRKTPWYNKQNAPSPTP